MDFQSDGTGADLLCEGLDGGRVALPEQANINGQPPLGRLQHPGDVQAPGVMVVALVPSAGPVPPPTMVVMPLHSAAGDLLRGR